MESVILVQILDNSIKIEYFIIKRKKKKEKKSFINMYLNGDSITNVTKPWVNAQQLVINKYYGNWLKLGSSTGSF